MTTESTYVIVGAGLAGAMAAETLRAEGFGGRVILIGDERGRPYERPPLSKEYLLGETETAGIYVHPADWYRQQHIELRLDTRVAGIHRSEHEVELATGERLRYHKLLLTTGSSPRSLPAPDIRHGVHHVRSVGDSELLRVALRETGASQDTAARGPSGGTSGTAGRVAVVGAGWVGLEVAAAARGYGAEVIVLEQEATPLFRALGPELGRVFAVLHQDHGVEVRAGTEVAELRGEEGCFRALVTRDRDVIEADTAVVAVGAEPNTGPAAAAWLEVGDGIIVDSSLRTNDPDIYAAGDVANAYHPLLGQQLRADHWANARAGGRSAARSMLGREVSYDDVPYFFSTQYDLGMEYSGNVKPNGYDEVAYRGDVRAREFIAFWLAGQRVVAGMNVNVPEVSAVIQQLVRAGRPVERDALTDPGVPLEDLL